MAVEIILGIIAIYLVVKIILGLILLVGGLDEHSAAAAVVGLYFIIEAIVILAIMPGPLGAPFVGTPEEGKIYIVVGSTPYNAIDSNATLTALQELKLDIANAKITPKEGTEFLYKTGEKLSFVPGDYVTYRAEKLERINLSLSLNPLNTSNSTGG